MFVEGNCEWTNNARADGVIKYPLSKQENKDETRSRKWGVRAERREKWKFAVSWDYKGKEVQN